MPRIVGIDIPKEKKIEIALTYIFGVGRARSNEILAEAGISPDKKAKDLSDQEISLITKIMQSHYQVEGDLRRQQAANIKRLMTIGTWRGIRHKKNLPVRGQRTRTNSRTRKGPRKTIGAAKGKGTAPAAAAPKAA
ncbi:MAG: 30S ribosomal protein S13 [Candidatus Omnitrophica bacterium]|jgi:small subunit ribosomal protein S13|nr:30S ribosomal protein S13 [Candidatus Omnitrophota bacterium]MDD4012843.1 30S ribosomal protein S13 [Candidatus Omnitrophota bacterium]